MKIDTAAAMDRLIIACEKRYGLGSEAWRKADETDTMSYGESFAFDLVDQAARAVHVWPSASELAFNQFRKSPILAFPKAHLGAQGESEIVGFWHAAKACLG